MGSVVRTSRCVTTADLRAAHGLVEEVRGLGADFAAWHRHLMDGLRAMLGAHVVIGGAFEGFAPGIAPKGLHIDRAGWADAASRRAWEEYVGEVPAVRTPEYRALAGFTGKMIVRRRDEVWEPGTWERSATYCERHRPAGISDWLMAIVAHRPRNEFVSVWVHRAVGEPVFSVRDSKVLTAVQESVGAMLGDELALASEPGLGGISRRQRRTLELVLTGLSEKQMAAELGVSRATVHEHVTAIYRRFGVSSRPELMTRFIGRARLRPSDPPQSADPSL